LISTGAPPQTALGSLQRFPKPIAGFKGPTSKGREGKGREQGEGMVRGGRERETPCPGLGK